MPHKSKPIEGAGLALTVSLALSATAQSPQDPPRPPEMMDYQGALQCAALTDALSVFQRPPYSSDDRRRSVQFLAWARVRAAEGGHDPKAAVKDMKVRRADFLRDAGRGTNDTRRGRLIDLYSSDYSYCNSILERREFVIVGG